MMRNVTNTVALTVLVLLTMGDVPAEATSASFSRHTQPAVNAWMRGPVADMDFSIVRSGLESNAGDLAKRKMPELEIDVEQTFLDNAEQSEALVVTAAIEGYYASYDSLELNMIRPDLRWREVSVISSRNLLSVLGSRETARFSQRMENLIEGPFSDTPIYGRGHIISAKHARFLPQVTLASMPTALMSLR